LNSPIDGDVMIDGQDVLREDLPVPPYVFEREAEATI